VQLPRGPATCAASGGPHVREVVDSQRSVQAATKATNTTIIAAVVVVVLHGL
jgi:hypothetical protein